MLVCYFFVVAVIVILKAIIPLTNNIGKSSWYDIAVTTSTYNAC